MSRDQTLVLTGLDGSNPLAFLAALGALRTLSLAWPGRGVRMSWVEHTGAWRPCLHADTTLAADAVTHDLDVQLKVMIGHRALTLADDLTVSPAAFRQFAWSVIGAADASNDSNVSVKRIGADFAAAFGCDALSKKKNEHRILDTALRTMSGAGHQHFLKTMRNVVEKTDRTHLQTTLFEPWTYGDPAEGESLRWDPADANRYAYSRRNPSGDPERKQRGGMRGANRLAIEGLPLVTSAPVGSALKTVGFICSKARRTFWTWPIWTYPISRDTCASLLAHPALVREPVVDAELRAMGVSAAFRSERVTVGKYRNFTPASPVF